MKLDYYIGTKEELKDAEGRKIQPSEARNMLTDEQWLKVKNGDIEQVKTTDLFIWAQER